MDDSNINISNILNDDIRVKAELLLSVPISPRVSHEKKLDIQKK
jgi:hypothetical protein